MGADVFDRHATGSASRTNATQINAKLTSEPAYRRTSGRNHMAVASVIFILFAWRRLFGLCLYWCRSRFVFLFFLWLRLTQSWLLGRRFWFGRLLLDFVFLFRFFRFGRFRLRRFGFFFPRRL